MEGALDADCVLTCHWHNWKFDLRTGATIYGGDTLRTYPVKVEDGAVWLDLRDPPAAQRIRQALGQLDHALAEYDTPRIARELARLAQGRRRPELALARIIGTTHARLRDGMTHAYAAADVVAAPRRSAAGRNAASRLRHRGARSHRLRHPAGAALPIHRAPRTVGCRELRRGRRVAGRARSRRLAQRRAGGRPALSRTRARACPRGARALQRFRPFAHLPDARATTDRANGTPTWNRRCCGPGCARSSTRRARTCCRISAAMPMRIEAWPAARRPRVLTWRRCVRRAVGPQCAGRRPWRRPDIRRSTSTSC